MSRMTMAQVDALRAMPEYVKCGKVQRLVVESLCDAGCWFPGCGWVWDTPSGTERVVRSLCTRNMARPVLVRGRVRWYPTARVIDVVRLQITVPRCETPGGDA